MHRLCVLLGSQCAVCAGMWLQMGISSRHGQLNCIFDEEPERKNIAMAGISTIAIFRSRGPRTANKKKLPAVV